jgi:hypothetical protein
MSTFRTFFSESYPVDVIGQITGSAEYAPFPNISGYVFRLQGRSTNLGSFMVGTASGTIAFEIDAGFDTDWFPLAGNNLNTLYFQNVSGSAERLTYWVKK